MSKLAFDHVHLISEDPHTTASWYVDKLGGTIARDGEVRGAPQIYVDFQGATIIVRGQRPGEEAHKKGELQWGTDHFGFQVEENLDAYCDRLRQKGVKFTVEPRDANPTTRIAFIEAPDGVSIELVHRQ